MDSLLDEKALRKPDVDTTDTVPIVLADGQAWLFPKPFVDFTPRFENGKAVLVVETDLKPFTDAYDDSKTMGDLWLARFNLAREMLSRVYDLTDEQLPALLKSREGDAAADERWQSILWTAMGLGPKQNPGGESSQ